MKNPIKVKMFGRGSFRPPIKRTTSAIDEYLSSLGERAKVVYNVWLNCAEDGWDGEGSVAVSESVLHQALRFLELLPKDIPICDPLGEPDGDICLEWYKDKDSILVSIGPQRIIITSLVAATQYQDIVEINEDLKVPDQLIKCFNLLYNFTN